MTLPTLRFLVLIAGTCTLAGAAEPISIGSRLELFVDNFLIDQAEGVEQVRQTPIPREVALVFDRP